LARNSAAAEKSESESEGGQKFLFPDPFPFCPLERKIKNSLPTGQAGSQKKFELRNKNSSKTKKSPALAGDFLFETSTSNKP